MHTDIIPFQPDMLEEAGVLLSSRHQRDRAVCPELPTRFDDPAAAAQAVAAVLQRPTAQGFAAVTDGRLVGYLIGERVIEEIWGRSGWVRLPGCALAGDQPADLIDDLYAVLGDTWMAHGCFSHYAVVPAANTEIWQAWFRLNFGLQQVYALLDLDDPDLPHHPVPPGIEIRRAGPEDREHLAALSDLIWRQLIQAPVWGIHLPESENRQGWAELVDDPQVTVWLAFENGDGGRVLGSQGFWPAEPSPGELLVSEHCIELSVAGTHPEARGRGIGQALTSHGLRSARQDGYHTCLTDWRSANRLAARFWPKRGFRPAAYRLARRIDPRIAWANWE